MRRAEEAKQKRQKQHEEVKRWTFQDFSNLTNISAHISANSPHTTPISSYVHPTSPTISIFRLYLSSDNNFKSHSTTPHKVIHHSTNNMTHTSSSSSLSKTATMFERVSNQHYVRVSDIIIIVYCVCGVWCVLCCALIVRCVWCVSWLYVVCGVSGLPRNWHRRATGRFRTSTRLPSKNSNRRILMMLIR